jgi:YebC/PmpR family DNA-binding regulatory protein
MAGHSKWANTRHRKARADEKRGKVFSKIAKEIMIAARQGGGDPAANITLKALIQKAKSYNMPADNIDRAIKKGVGDIDGAALEELSYEGYAPGGVAVLVTVLTDNRNRSVSEVRFAFSKHGGSLGGAGSVSHLFQRKGQIFVEAEGVEEVRLFEIALDSGADDVKLDGSAYEIITEPAVFMNVVEALDRAELTISSSELVFLPGIEVPVSDRSLAETLIRFVDAVEDLDDVQSVYANFSIDDDIMDALNAE